MLKAKNKNEVNAAEFEATKQSESQIGITKN